MRVDVKTKEILRKDRNREREKVGGREKRTIFRMRGKRENKRETDSSCAKC